jgi:hypothetical protein
MDKTLIFSSLSFFIYLFWATVYIRDIFKWKAIPHPFSWLGWAIIVSINFYGLVSVDGVSWSIIPIGLRVLNLIFCTIAWFILIKKIKINSFDIVCLILSLLCIVIFYYMWLSEAIFASIIVDLLLFFPTIKKIYLSPMSDTPTLRITAALVPFFILLSIKTYTFESSAYWIEDLLLNVIVAWLIIYRKRQKNFIWRVKHFLYQCSSFLSHR